MPLASETLVGEQAIELAQRLFQLLELEASVLAAQDLQRLQSLPAEKQALLEALNEQQALLADCSSSQLDRLRRVLEQCHAANERNGRVIHSQQASTQSLLSILRGADEGGATYAPPGNSRSSARSLTLGLA